MRAARDQLEKAARCPCQVPPNDSPRISPAGISAFRVAGQGTGSTVCDVLPQCAYMRTINVILSERASRAQDYLTSRAKGLDKIRGLWTAIVQRREALMVCLSHLGLASLPALSPAWLAICLASLMPTSYALQELLLTEEKTAKQLELDREKDSVAYLSQARADVEGTISLS